MTGIFTRRIRLDLIADPTSVADTISLVASQIAPTTTGIWESSTAPVPDTPAGPELVMTPTGPVAWQPRAYKKREGNGHKKLKVRDLLGPEKDSIRSFFLFKNGMIGNDDCVGFKLQMVAEVAIFQITGFVSYLHCQVAEGIITLQDLIKYEGWMRAKYHDTLWARYNYKIYMDIRTQNQALIAAGQAPTAKVSKNYKPKFAAFPKT